MQCLWAGWRMSYIESARAGDEACLFCVKPRAGADEQELLLERGEFCFTMLNAFPYSTGHVMVAPFRHVDSFAHLSAPERLELLHLLARAEEVLGREYRPHGFNMGVNLGAAAGAGVVGHLHAHLVPRWTGDTNFMSTVGETRVVPEDLARTYERLRRAFAQIGGSPSGTPDAGAAR